MKKSLLTFTLVLAASLLAVLSSAGSGPDQAAPKAATPALKSVSCPPECGFMCRSHDEKELIEIVKAHAKNAHGKILTDEQIKSFMQSEETSASGR